MTALPEKNCKLCYHTGMSSRIEFPFYANTSDGTHCFQAALRMILKYFIPEKDFSWELLDKLTAKSKNMWTWPMAGLVWMQEQGFEVINIEKFDYKRFIENPEGYLEKRFGADIAQEQIKNSNIAQETEFAKKFINQVKTENRIAVIDEISELLEDGYLVITNVNARSLNDQEGYIGHFVVVNSCNNNTVTIQDPGSPPMQNKKVSIQQFTKGWAYPDESTQNLMAFRLNKNK
jgi:hypothetical protein